jgi:hypothetical protein
MEGSLEKEHGLLGVYVTHPEISLPVHSDLRFRRNKWLTS